jgi:hypothetical protein
MTVTDDYESQSEEVSVSVIPFPADGSEHELVDDEPTAHEPGHSPVVEAAFVVNDLALLARTLPDVQRIVFRWYYGIGCRAKSLATIAERLCTDEDEIEKILWQALERCLRPARRAA